MKTALITGASRGIGAACAVAFAKSGYNIVLNYNKSEQRALSLSKVLSDSYGVDVLCIKADVTDRLAVNEMMKSAVEKFGFIDVLVNNAGVSLIKLFTEMTQDEWNDIINADLNSVFNCSQQALLYMLKEHRGSIVNISSMWGQTGASCEVAYSAAKAGVIGLTKALSKEVAPSGIRVNCVCPGVVMTDMMSDCDEETVQKLKEETPLLTLGSAKDIADAVLFLSSDKARYITGQVLGVNGGLVI